YIALSIRFVGFADNPEVVATLGSRDLSSLTDSKPVGIKDWLSNPPTLSSNQLEQKLTPCLRRGYSHTVLRDLEPSSGAVSEAQPNPPTNHHP
ncbi:MAG: hypothetical protein Q9204_000511, partial [Flavoplaca sp. TL-2023a]